MGNNKNYLIIIILYLISFSASASVKLNGMVVLPSDNGIFSAVINLDNKFENEYVMVRDGYAMDYYRYNMEHSVVFADLDIKINKEKDSSFVLIKSLKPLNENFDIVIRLVTNKNEVLGVYKVINNPVISYIPNEINEESALEENKKEQVNIITAKYSYLNEDNSEFQSNKNETTEVVQAIDNKKQDELFNTNCYYVKKGDNLTKIAKKMLYDPSYKTDMNLNQLVNKIYDLNKQAFIKGDINKLKQNCCLLLPKSNITEEQLSTEVDNIEVAIEEKADKVNMNLNEKVNQMMEAQNHQIYYVAKGDCLSTVAVKLKEFFPGKSWREIMMDIYNNPDNEKCFIKGNINLVKSGSILKIQSTELTVSTDMVANE
jgi:hypothetical protein